MEWDLESSAKLAQIVRTVYPEDCSIWDADHRGRCAVCAETGAQLALADSPIGYRWVNLSRACDH